MINETTNNIIKTIIELTKQENPDFNQAKEDIKYQIASYALDCVMDSKIKLEAENVLDGY